MIVKEIQVPPEWEITNDWDSHRPMLWLATQNKGLDIVEMGSGNGSTLLLDTWCHNAEDSKFLSIEDTPEKGVMPIYGYSIIRDGYLKIRDRWPEIFKSFEVGILFVDCAPGETRKTLIEEWANEADVIIAHDTEESAQYVYGMSEILYTFKYRLDYQPECKPHSVAVSNFIDVTKWITQD